MTCYKVRFSAILIILLSLASCRMPDNNGFYQPITLSVTVPDGPPEFKAGWYAGCRTALGAKVFANAFVHQKDEGAEFGSGVYQHDSVYQAAWGQAWFACITHVNGFVKEHAMKIAPLSY